MSAVLARIRAAVVRQLKWVATRSAAFAYALIALGARVAMSVSNRVTQAVAVRSYGFFDATFYLSQFPESPWGVRNAISHYLSVGAQRGFDPHPLFDSKYYLDRNPDVAKAGTNPLVHYLLLGAAQGLKPHPALDESPVIVENLLERYPSYRKAFYDKYPLPRKWYDAESPEVTIVILAYHNSGLTIHCLDSVWRNTEGATYEVIVLDNGSSLRDIMAVSCHLFAGRLVALLVNRGFGEGNNIACDFARGKYLFFLNNDAAVTGNWLEPLLEVMRRHPEAGAVGAKLLYPNGVLQEAGAMVLESGDTVQIGKGDVAAKPNYNVVNVVDYCSAAALLVKKTLFEESLGFDHRFDPAYYEDADLCFKLRELGSKVYFCPNSIVIHQEAASGKDPKATVRLQNVVETNKAKFLGKWRPILTRASYRSLQPTEPQVANSGLPVAGIRHFETGSGGPRLGLYSQFAVVPGGGERYLFSIAEIMNEYACKVDFVTPHRYSTLRVAEVTGELGLDIAAIRLRTLAEIERDRPYDIFVSIGNRVVPPIAGHGVRNFYICQFPFPATELPKERYTWYDNYDSVLVYSNFCARNFENAARKAGLDPLPTIVVQPPVAMASELTDSKKRMILTVGRFFVGDHNKKQLEMVRAFRRMCEDGLSDWEFHLAGGVQPEFEHREYFLAVRDESDGYPIVVHANPSRTELEQLYRDASIYWHAAGLDEDVATHPERFEHFGIATVEAMSAGAVPIVLGEGGQCEIVEDGSSGLLWHGADELVTKTNEIIDLHEQSSLNSMRRAAARRASEFDVRRFRDRMEVVLDIGGLRNKV